MYEGIKLNIPLEGADDKVSAFESMQEKIEQEKRFDEYKNCGVPEKFWNESFDTFKFDEKQTQIKYNRDKAMEFAKNPKNRVIILHGNNGTGKTHLLSSILREAGGEYITSSILCVKYESATGYKAKMSREEIIDHYIKAKGVLVIDECCKYFLNSDIEKFILLTILCGRYENNRATALGTNSDRQPFIEFLGKAVFDRFTEVCTTLKFDWESQRKNRRG